MEDTCGACSRCSAIYLYDAASQRVHGMAAVEASYAIAAPREDAGKSFGAYVLT